MKGLPQETIDRLLEEEMKKTYNIRLNRDGTITVRVGRSVEHMSVDGKTKAQLFDAVKWALVSKNCHISDERLTEDLHPLLYG